MKKYKRYFQKALQKHFPDRAAGLQAATEETFGSIQGDIAFSKRSKNPIDRRMEIAGYFLATVMVLDKEKVDYETIRNILLEIACDYVRPKNQLQVFLKRLPAKLLGTKLATILLAQFDAKVRTKGHPAGFMAHILTKKEERPGFIYGFDIMECGICKLFAKHHYQKFVPILCEVDHITSNLAGLSLTRTGTIANGAAKCDFRFTKISATSAPE